MHPERVGKRLDDQLVQFLRVYVLDALCAQGGQRGAHRDRQRDPLTLLIGGRLVSFWSQMTMLGRSQETARWNMSRVFMQRPLSFLIPR